MKLSMNQVLSDCMGERLKFRDRPDSGQRPQSHWLVIWAQTPHRSYPMIHLGNTECSDEGHHHHVFVPLASSVK